MLFANQLVAEQLAKCLGPKAVMRRMDELKVADYENLKEYIR